MGLLLAIELKVFFNDSINHISVLCDTALNLERKDLKLSVSGINANELLHIQEGENTVSSENAGSENRFEV